MFANENSTSGIARNVGFAAYLKLMSVALFVIMVPLNASAAWKEIRTSAAGRNGWVNLVCDSNASGWNSCELDLVIKLTATPAQLVAIGEQSTINATVTDAYGDPVEAGVKITWTSTDGTVSAPVTLTDANGNTSVILTSSHTIGGTTITASSTDYGGSGSIYVPFTDKLVPYPSAYTTWADYGSVYSCSGWSPDPSTVPAGTWFTQWSNCWQTQIQYRQDRVQSVVTGAITNTGAPVALFQAIVVSISQANVGTLVTGPVCLYTGNSYIGDKSACRGGGESNPRSGVYLNGVSLTNRIPDINGSPAAIYNGLTYYAGAEMTRQNISCAGDLGVVIFYQICHD
ncbi:Ig-like domain-containing protein [Pseudomonas sp. NPDC089569]|uniref:Ig-like domain-containing protein n=1 Tax=Pseudomonas sp. NPDC089569 TaxID=3390722 RepID=UPI003CFBE2E7